MRYCLARNCSQYLYKIKQIFMDILAQQITELNKQLSTQLPIETLQAFQKSIQDLIERKIENNSLTNGDIFPSFSLKNQHHTTITLEDSLDHEKLIIAFLRGSWCPYCNLELKALVEEIEKNDAIRFIFITPQNENANLEWASEYKTSSFILSDKENKLAKEVGIEFELQDHVIDHYKNLGIDLLKINTTNNYTLPIPAVYVLDKNATIIYNFVNANYMQRINIDELKQYI